MSEFEGLQVGLDFGDRPEARPQTEVGCQPLVWPEVGDRVVFSEAERRVAEFLAKLRVRRNEGEGWVSKRVGDMPEHVPHWHGILGEIAMARMTNTYPDLSSKPVRTKRADLRVGHLRVEVKARKVHPNTTNGLMVRKGSVEGGKAHPDVFVLILLPEDLSAGEYAGCVAARDFLVPTNVREFGYGPSYYMPAGALQAKPPTQTCQRA